MNLTGIIMVVILALPVSVISLTFTKAAIFESFRERVMAIERDTLLKTLVTCPYCMNHWISFLVTAIYRPVIIESSHNFINYFISAFTIVAISTPLCWVIFRSYKTIDPSNQEIEVLREILGRARERLVEQSLLIKKLQE